MAPPIDTGQLRLPANLGQVSDWYFLPMLEPPAVGWFFHDRGSEWPLIEVTLAPIFAPAPINDRRSLERGRCEPCAVAGSFLSLPRLLPRVGVGWVRLDMPDGYLETCQVCIVLHRIIAPCLRRPWRLFDYRFTSDPNEAASWGWTTSDPRFCPATHPPFFYCVPSTRRRAPPFTSPAATEITIAEVRAALGLDPAGEPPVRFDREGGFRQ